VVVKVSIKSMWKIPKVVDEPKDEGNYEEGVLASLG
jgi:hypothetical protein